MKKYNTIINFVEPTMILKRVTVDTFNNTYPLGHEYDSSYNNLNNAPTILPANETYQPDIITPYANLYKMQYFSNDTIKVYAIKMQIKGQSTSGTVDAVSYPAPTTTTVKIDGSTVFSNTLSYNEIDDNGTLVYELNLSNHQNASTITIEYTASLSSPGITYFPGRVNFQTISVLKAISSVPRIQLNAVCKRIFEGSLGRRENDPVRFKLDDTTEQWFSQITAPEYCFTRSTLYEVLMEIGGTKEVNAVPRLLWNEETNAFDTITFIKQGDSQDEYTLPATVQLTGEEVDQASEEYCEEFDSYAENMVNTLDATRGSIVEPSANGDTYYFYATTSEELTITDNTSIIGTSRPIYRVIKLIANYNRKSADITPYLFEAAEYDNLSSYTGAYPYAKEWALRYAQGDNKITGLCLKAEQVTDIGQNIAQMAIYKILWRTGVITDGSKPGICNIGFNITYISINTGRVKQRKPYLDWKGSGTQFYNQGGNVVEMDYYGNHLKNRLARIGNPIKRYTFRLQGQVRPPKIGQVFYDEEDGELLYISQVDEERGLTYTLITMWLTRNVNRLYGYTAINSRKRQYAIDERMSVDRHINISENIYIGDSVEESDTSFTSTGIRTFMSEFNGSSYTEPVGQAISRGMNGTEFVGENNTAHPVTCAAFGNSIYFGFRYADNYSAGNQSVDLASAKRMVRAVPYGDDNGMFDYLNVVLQTGGVVAKYDYPEHQAVIGDPAESIIIFNSYSPHGRIPVYKDSRDIIHVEVQEHFIATRRSIIIGSELAFCNRLIRGTSGTFGVAFLPYRLNEQRETLTIENSNKAGTMASADVTISGRKAAIRAYTNTTGAAAKSWAIYNTENNRLVLGENMDIAAGGQTLPFVFNF